jgi:Fe-Mn family superoxide dismutase
MSKSGKRIPSGEFEMKINQTFGNYDNFKKIFKAKALDVFGSGYAWLAADKNNALKIIQTQNQDTPLTRGMCPIMCIDVWEHAYYLKHYNMRANYIDDWFNVVDLDKAALNYKKAQEK